MIYVKLFEFSLHCMHSYLDVLGEFFTLVHPVQLTKIFCWETISLSENLGSVFVRCDCTYASVYCKSVTKI